ncbi:hypothetical protein HGRIS_003506 [Hohenbuehelia grisea]|uniref:TRAF-type domain-containing protein n=1 Tax=Hohenbuehelia grisea TaxID=104357 RepID=A0ABR3JFP4_9AGAR
MFIRVPAFRSPNSLIPYAASAACIEQALEHSPHCPVDRSPLSSDDLVQANPIVKSLVDELLIECTNRSAGCLSTFQRQLLASHLKDSCQATEMSCPEEDCDKVVLRKEIGKHSHECLHRLVKCDACQTQVKFISLEDHLADCPVKIVTCDSCSLEVPRSEIKLHVSGCPEVFVGCPHSDNGCPWQGPRRSLDTSHIPTCPFEAIKGFFDINETRLSALTDENTLLKHKVDALEGLTQTLRREMQSVKMALGPWFRPDGIRPPLVQHSSAEVPPEFQPWTASTSQNSYDPPGTTNPGIFSPPLTAVPDALAPYFPSDNDERHWSNPCPPQYVDPVRRGMHRPSSSVPELPYTSSAAYAAYNRLEPNAVAPINLSTTLEGALEGLRESVVTLASSVDSSARRNDIALTNETLRMNEELMSLRANVHGLRMQVHTIMMDRNAQVTGRPSDHLVEGWQGLPPPRMHFNPASPASITKL